MIRLIRIALQIVLALLLVMTVIGFFSSETGAAEKAVLVLIGGAVIWAASRVRGIAARPA
jgi:hypothetical protein